MARTEVTKALTQYIKEHNLQDANDKRTILPDNKLSKLLKCNSYTSVEKTCKANGELHISCTLIIYRY